jgi:hypothetical protein
MTHAVEMNATVDVVVPCYRYGCYLAQCVQSILDQAEVQVRVLIIDDASPDESADIGADIARSSENVMFLRHERNKGHIRTYNEGIEWAGATYFLLLSADDYLLPGALAYATRMMEASPDIGLVFGNALVEFDDGATESVYPLYDRGEKAGDRVFRGLDFVRLSGASNLVPTPTAVARTETQKRIGVYRPELPHSGDMEMWLRFAAHGSVGFVDRLQAVYRRHAGNMSNLYDVASSLPDLLQRKAAIDSFLQSDGRNIAGGNTLLRELHDDLGRIAIGRASAAFNTGDARALRQLTEFAVDISPMAKLSLPWMRLMAKRMIGQRAWKALQSGQQAMRPR